MFKLFPARLAGLGLAAVTAVFGATPVRHDFVAIDEGLVQVLRVDERDGTRNWITPVGRPMPRDLQLIGAGRLLVGHDAGYSEFDLATGKRLREFAAFKGVTSARRRPDGGTLLAGANLDGATGVVLLELDASDRVRRRSVLPGNYVRLVRETAQGTVLLVCNTTIREIDRAGTELQAWTVPGFRNAWKAVRLADGRTLASAGYGAFLVELDPRGSVTRSFGGREQVPAEVKPNFYASFQVLANGDVVAANWQGHGPGHGASGVQLVQFDRTGTIVWRWSDARIISSLQGILVLDGLDLTKLHDEREGVMRPLP